MWCERVAVEPGASRRGVPACRWRGRSARWRPARRWRRARRRRAGRAPRASGTRPGRRPPSPRTGPQSAPPSPAPSARAPARERPTLSSSASRSAVGT